MDPPWIDGPSHWGDPEYERQMKKDIEMASRNREELQKQFEADGKTRFVRTEDVDAEIVDDAYYHFLGTTVTVCCLTLQNGFTVIGQSACANVNNFDEQLGRDLARDDAKQQCYRFLAFRMLDVTA